MSNLAPLRQFVNEVEQRIEPGLGDELARRMVAPMARLVSSDDWLPAAMAAAQMSCYQQHLLYADPRERFSIVSFVWGPGQATPIHNHTVWGVIGVLRGAEYSQRYDVSRDCRPALLGTAELLAPGQVDIVSPTHGDVHVVRNAYADRVSISIHLYGGNIGRIGRSVFDSRTGARKTFVSGYSAVLKELLV